MSTPGGNDGAARWRFQREGAKAAQERAERAAASERRRVRTNEGGAARRTGRMRALDQHGVTLRMAARSAGEAVHAYTQALTDHTDPRITQINVIDTLAQVTLTIRLLLEFAGQHGVTAAMVAADLAEAKRMHRDVDRGMAADEDPGS